MLMNFRCFERKCIHFLRIEQRDGTEESEQVVCKAFPDGIPDEIAFGNNLHKEKYPGQKNDYLYEKGVQ